MENALDIADNETVDTSREDEDEIDYNMEEDIDLDVHYECELLSDDVDTDFMFDQRYN